MQGQEALTALIVGLFGAGGTGAIVSIIGFWRNRKKVRPEIDAIVAEGAKNAVEALQVALHSATEESRSLREELQQLRREHKVEIDRLTAQLKSAQELLDAAHEQIEALSKDLEVLRQKVAEGAHKVQPPE